MMPPSTASKQTSIDLHRRCYHCIKRRQWWSSDVKSVSSLPMSYAARQLYVITTAFNARHALVWRRQQLSWWCSTGRVSALPFDLRRRRFFLRYPPSSPVKSKPLQNLASGWVHCLILHFKSTSITTYFNQSQISKYVAGNLHLLKKRTKKLALPNGRVRERGCKTLRKEKEGLMSFLPEQDKDKKSTYVLLTLPEATTENNSHEYLLKSHCDSREA